MTDEDRFLIWLQTPAGATVLTRRATRELALRRRDYLTINVRSGRYFVTEVGCSVELQWRLDDGAAA